MSQQPQYTPAASQRTNGTPRTDHVNIMAEVLASGIAAVYKGTAAQPILLMLAGFAKRDSRSYDFRQAWAYQDDWAEKLGVSRQTVNDNLQRLTADGVIAKAGKRHVKNRPPANIYRIAEFEELVSLVPKLRKPRKYNVDNLARGRQPVGQTRHNENGNLSDRPDTLLSSVSDRLPGDVSSVSDTEVAVKSERELEGYFAGCTDEGDNFGETADPPQQVDDDEPVREQIRTVNDRLQHLLRKAGLSASRHNQIVAQINGRADGCTLPQKLELFEAEVEQLEFEFYQGVLA